MALRVLCQEHPRTIALVANDHALLLRHSPVTSESVSSNSYSNVIPARCIVELARLSSLDLSNYRSLGSGHGTLGLIALDSDVFLCLITHSSKVATVRPGENVLRIDNVDFYCLNRSYYDAVMDYEARSGYTFTTEDNDNTPTSYEGRDAVTESPFVALKKLLSDGSFYYSTDFNLTNRLQDRANDKVDFTIESLDEGFLWNSYLINPLLQFRSRLTDHERQALDSARILTSVVRGYVQSLTIPASSPLLPNNRSTLPSAVTLVSRLSSRKAGTRFNSRGIDDDGNVANFVETETVLWMPPGICFSYTQVRGSVPIFWEQSPGLIPGQQKIQVARSVGATQPAFDKHFESLETDYGAVHVVNLLSELKPGEVEISERFRYHISRSPLNNSDHCLLRFTDFDFHAETRGPNGYEGANTIRPKVDQSADSFGYFLCEDFHNGADRTLEKAHDVRTMPKVILQQEGTFRTNCLDCLDRTNLVQTLLSRVALEIFLEHQHATIPSDFWMRHSTLWADNGDNLSKIYAGTGALKSSFTRHGKMSLSGAIADARKSATRLYVNNFADKERQNTIDVLLGSLVGQAPVYLYDPVNDATNAELARRAAEYTSSKNVRIWAGTFNLNGKSHGASEDLAPWLLGHLQHSLEAPVMIAVGFQEIVELSPQQIMSTNPGNRGVWEDAVQKTLNKYASQRDTSKYILLRSGQLVGAALLLFVREDILGEVKNVEGNVKKTGMSGMAGNKGGCAIRLDYANTRICFVTAHLAAGLSNYEERNNDFNTINGGLRFQRNKAIRDHDSIIWMGDFNYRIGVTNERARELIEMGDLETLYDSDQLNLQMVAGVAFPYYSEGRINFPPTYRYDNGTDRYDTSEKARIPAWCDRILWKGSNLRQLQYSTAPLRFSDHRPVYATFECVISTVNEKLKEKLRKEILDKQKAFIGDATAHLRSEDTDDEDLIAFDPIATGLPPASSDRRQPVRANVKPPVGSALNPRRAPNPFNPTTGSSESDWVHVSHPESADRSSEARPQSMGRGQGKNRGPPPPPPPSRPVQPMNLMDSVVRENENTDILTSPLTPGRSASEATSDHAKKARPPIPRKPASLATNRPAASSARSEQSSDASPKLTGAAVYKPPPLPTRKPTVEGSTSTISPATTTNVTPTRGNIPVSPSVAPARVGELRNASQQGSGSPGRSRGGSPSSTRGQSGTGAETPEMLSLSQSMSTLSPKSASPVPVRGEKEVRERERRDMLMDNDESDGLLGWQALKPT